MDQSGRQPARLVRVTPGSDAHHSSAGVARHGRGRRRRRRGGAEPGVTVALPVAVLSSGVVGSAVLALLAGTVPAVRAARLPARDAMGEG